MSLGSMGLADTDFDSQLISKLGGEHLHIGEFMAEVMGNFEDGYPLQELITPRPKSRWVDGA